MTYAAAPPTQATIPLTRNCGRAFTLEYRDSAGQRAAWPEGAAVLMRIGTDEIPAAIQAHNATFNLSAALCDEITNATRFAIVLDWGALQLPVLVGRFARFDG